MSRVWTVVVNETRLLGADPYPVLMLIAMPLVLMAFLSDGMVGGPGQSVPGLLVLFAFLGLYNAGLVFFRDHGWRTWGRMRTLPIGIGEVVAGKSVPVAALYMLQSIVLLGVGYLAFDMPMEGDVAVLGVVVVAVVITMSALGLLLVSLCRTMNQVAAVSNVGGLVLAGIGGALSPVDTLPEWAQRLAPLSPVYWGLLALRGVIVDGDTLAETAVPLAVLVATAIVSASVALVRFEAADAKEYYA